MISDIIIVFVVLFFVVIGAIRGFAKSLLNIAGFIGAIIFANIAAQALSEWIFDAFIRNQVIDSINEVNIATGMDSVINNVFSVLPQWVNGIVTFFSNLLGLDTNETVALFTESTPAESMTATVLTDSIISPVVTGIFALFIGIILFIAFLLIIKMIIKLIDKIFQLPVLKQLNCLLGGIFGAAEGIIIVFLAVNICAAFMNLTDPDVLTDSSINGVLFSLLRFTA